MPTTRAQNNGISTKRLWRQTVAAFNAVEKRLQALRSAWDGLEDSQADVAFEELQQALDDAQDELKDCRDWANEPPGSA